MLKHTFEKCLVALGLPNLLPVLVACADDDRTRLLRSRTLDHPGLEFPGFCSAPELWTTRA
jgi:hypothetical protein